MLLSTIWQYIGHARLALEFKFSCYLVDSSVVKNSVQIFFEKFTATVISLISTLIGLPSIPFMLINVRNLILQQVRDRNM